jgi:molecular chaperone DnaK (HSP70)
MRVAGGPVAAVTLTHPAGWGPLRREILAEAARRAALPPVTLVPEPIATGIGLTQRSARNKARARARATAQDQP